ncbi:hypothetical protein D3C86_1503590 [compost metagenome]
MKRRRRKVDLLIHGRAVPVGKVEIPRQARPALLLPDFVIAPGQWQTWCPGASHYSKPGRLVFVAGRDLRHAVGVELAVGMFNPIQSPYRLVDGLDLWRGEFAQRLVQLIAEVFLALFDPAPAQRVAVTHLVEQIRRSVFINRMFGINHNAAAPEGIFPAQWHRGGRFRLSQLPATKQAVTKLARASEAQVLVQQVMARRRIGPALKSFLSGGLPCR